MNRAVSTKASKFDQTRTEGIGAGDPAASPGGRKATAWRRAGPSARRCTDPSDNDASVVGWTHAWVTSLGLRGIETGQWGMLRGSRLEGGALQGGGRGRPSVK